MPACFLALLLVAAAGKPLHYWGSQAPVIALEVARGQGVAAQVEEVHAAMDKGSLALRFTFDRPVAQALYLPDGKPVSGRVNPVLYLDADGDRASGYDAGAADLRTGADYSLEIGVLALGEDPEEERKAEAVVTVVLYSLEGRRRRTVWRGDGSATPDAISIYGEWIDLRLPAGTVAPKPGARIAIAAGGRSADGRLLP